MYVVIVVGNLLGGGAPAAMQSIVSNAADAQRQGETMGAVGVAQQPDGGGRAGGRRAAAGPGVAPAAGDWRIGAPILLLRRAAGRGAALIALRISAAARPAATPRPCPP